MLAMIVRMTWAWVLLFAAALAVVGVLIVGAVVAVVLSRRKK